MRRESWDSRPLLMDELESVLGVRGLVCLIGVLGHNRKVTLQLFDPFGQPVGYCKTGSNDITRRFVRTEQETLRHLRGGGTMAHSPKVVAEGKWMSLSYVVTSPLPRSVRAASTLLPSPAHLADIFPLTRRAPVSATDHFRQILLHVRGYPAEPTLEPLRRETLALLGALEEITTPVPVAARGHGDFVPWNAAWDPGGHLWLWDWESSSVDVPAGLDSIHWALNTLPGRGRPDLIKGVESALEVAAPHLRAFGLHPSSWPALSAAYCVSLVEQVWSYAVGSSGWNPGSITADDLLDLVLHARRRLVTR